VSVAEHLVFDRTPTSLTVQFVPLRVRAGRLEILVCPGQSAWTLPSGAPDAGSPLEEEAPQLGARLLGLHGTPMQLGAFGRPADGLSVVFLYLVRPPPPGRSMPKSSVPGGTWWDVRGIRPAPDVDVVAGRALARLEYDVEYGLSGFAMVDERFTVSELRRVHQAVRNVELDPSNFRKRVNRWVCEGLVEELDAMRATATRPARLFRLR
jgi:hypothetical protein